MSNIEYLEHVLQGAAEQGHRLARGHYKIGPDSNTSEWKIMWLTIETMS